MDKAIIGKKIGMTQIFTKDGAVIPVTVVEAGPCHVVQIKTKDNDGYEAVQMGFGAIKEKKVTKPLKGHFLKAKVAPEKVLKEFRFANCASYTVGQEIKCDVFKEGEKIDVSGVSKGHGFTGPIKRWNQHRGPMAHGSGYHRGVGSMGACSSPSRVFKNKHMAGQWGHEKVTVQNLLIARVDVNRNLLLIKGAIPGPKDSIVFVKQTAKG